MCKRVCDGAPPPAPQGLWTQLKSCRSRRELTVLEQKLHFDNAKHWNMRITAHARVGNRRRALNMPREMRRVGVAPDVITYNRLVKACEWQWQEALSLLEQMKKEGIEPNVITYSTAISACEKGGQWTEALRLLQQMRGGGIEPTVITYNATISACEKAGQWTEALSLLDQMRGGGIEPNVITYNAAILACQKGVQWTEALSLLEQMRGESITPNVITYNLAILACEKGRQWSEVLRLLDEMRGQGIQPEVTTYSVAISACEKSGQGEKALSLLRQMRGEGVEPDVVAYNAAISACEKVGRWRDALALFVQMRSDGVEPDVITYGAVIAACGRDAQWEQALRLLQLCPAPDAIAYNAAIQACAAAGQPAAALRVFAEARRQKQVTRVTHNAVLDAVATADPAAARALYRRVRGRYGAVEGAECSVPMLDLHGHSEGAGETAVRWWLEERAPGLPGDPARLIIVTGWGRSRGVTQDGDLRGRVARVLAELGAPTLPEDNPGRFVVDARAWRLRRATRDGISPPPPPTSCLPSFRNQTRTLRDGEEPLPHIGLSYAETTQLPAIRMQACI